MMELRYFLRLHQTPDFPQPQRKRYSYDGDNNKNNGDDDKNIDNSDVNYSDGDATADNAG